METIRTFWAYRRPKTALLLKTAGGGIRYGGRGRRTRIWTRQSTLEALAAEQGIVPINLEGNSGSNRLTGNDGANILEGHGGGDTLIGGGGNDIFHVHSSTDVVADRAGVDTVKTEFSYTLRGGLRNRKSDPTRSILVHALSLTGDSGANTIRGNAGRTTLNGMGGDDILYGKNGMDVLSGGAGRDIFVFDTKPKTSSNRDKIIDFKPLDDTIYLENAVFKKVGKGLISNPGNLSKAFFRISDKARDKNDCVVYDPKKGILWYDADGSGKGAAVQTRHAVEETEDVLPSTFW